MAAIAAPAPCWGATPTTPAATSLADIMAVEAISSQAKHSQISELASLLPHLSKQDVTLLLSLSQHDVAVALNKAFDLGEQGLEALLHPPLIQTQAESDHDLAVALSLAGQVDQATAAAAEDVKERDLALPIKPAGIMRHDKALSEQYNSDRLSGRPGVGDLANLKISNRVYNSLSNMNHRRTAKGMEKHGGGRAKGTQTQRSTTDGVFDQKTKQIIMSLMNKEVLESMGGVIATGKEASCYSAFGVGVPRVHDTYGGRNNKHKNNSRKMDDAEDPKVGDRAVKKVPCSGFVKSSSTCSTLLNVIPSIAKNV